MTVFPLCLCPNYPPLISTPALDEFNLSNYICQDPISNYCPILMFLVDLDFWRTLFQPSTPTNYSLTPVLVSLAATTEYHSLLCALNSRCLFLTVLEARCPR